MQNVIGQLKMSIRNIKDVFSLSYAEVINALLAVLSAYLFANYVDKSVYGNYQFVLSILGLLTIFTLQGLNKNITYKYIRDKVNYLIPSTVTYIKYAIPATLVGMFIGGYFIFHNNHPLGYSIIAISVFMPIIRSLPMYESILLGQKNYSQLAKTLVFRSFIPLLLLATAVFLQFDLLELILVYCTAQALTLAIIYYHTHKNDPLEKSLKYDVINEDVHLSVNYSLLAFSKIIDRLVVFSLFGPTVLASYMIALLPVREMMRLPQILRKLVLPRFSEYSYSQVRQKILIKTLLIFLGFLSISITYSVIAPYIFQFLFPNYLEAIMATQILSFLLPLSAVFILNETFTVFGMSKELYVVNISNTFISILAITGLSLLFGIAGLIAAKLLASTIRFILCLFLIYRKQF